MKTRFASPLGKHPVVTMAMLALIATACALLPDAALAGDQVRIHGRYSTAIRLYELSTGELLDVVNGAGKASHLGNSFLHIEKVLSISGCGDPLCFAGDFRMIAANGASVSGTIEGGGTPQPDGTVPFTGTFTFTGGTGRFQGATGSADIIGLANLVTLQAAYSFSGTISLP